MGLSKTDCRHLHAPMGSLFYRNNRHPIYFGTHSIDPGMLRLVCGVTLAVLLIVISLLRPPLPHSAYRPPAFQNYRIVHVETVSELIEHLKDRDLWDREVEGGVPPLIFHRFPSNFTDLDNDTKKKAFLHALLPAALVALNEVEGERAALENILNKITDCPPELRFDRNHRSWQASLTDPEKMYLQFLVRKYRTEEVSKLLLRVNTVPVSLILAQGAVESSWGASRFVLEGNNIFGIWTWGKDGIVPLKREQGKNHKVAAYESLLDSVRAYLLTLNRVPAYTRLRRIRTYSMDPYDLAQGLIYYSERRADYVEEISNIIKTNELIKYDRCKLSGDD